MTSWWRRKIERDIAFEASVLGDDLDGYLSASESRIANIRPGLHKQIVWADPANKAKTRYAIVYLHGFSASPGEIRPVPDLVAQHLNANLYFTRLNGHGADGGALGRATIDAWTRDVAEAIAIGERLGEKVIVMATSTGGALATWALAQPALARHVAAAVLLSPNYRLLARAAFLLSGPFARQLVHIIVGRTRSFEPINAAHAHIWTCSYPSDALLPMAQAIKLASGAKVETAKMPALFLYSPSDQTVDPEGTKAVAARWGAPHRLVALERTADPSAHVLTGDALSPANTMPVAAMICDWLDTTLPPA